MTKNTSGSLTDFGGQTNYYTTTRSDFYDVTSQASDSPGSDDSRWTPEWARWHGWYRKIPELRAVIDKLVSFTFGRGIKANKKNLEKLGKIRGNGKESSRIVLKNQWKGAIIAGDSFAHIVKDKQGRMTNLKPLNAGRVSIIYDDYGIIESYELSINDGKKTLDIDEVFHLSYNRLGDEMHGIPFVEALQELVKARTEALNDLRILYHRNIKPIQFFEVKTKDNAKLSALEANINLAYKKSENVVIPEGILAEIKNTSTPQYSNLDSLNYIKFLVRLYVSSCGVPEVIMGWAENISEASANIVYLSFQQEIEDMQLYIQEMTELQLNIKLDLEFPASLEQKIKENESKRGKGTSLVPGKDG